MRCYSYHTSENFRIVGEEGAWCLVSYASLDALVTAKQSVSVSISGSDTYISSVTGLSSASNETARWPRTTLVSYNRATPYGRLPWLADWGSDSDDSRQEWELGEGKGKVESTAKERPEDRRGRRRWLIG